MKGLISAGGKGLKKSDLQKLCLESDLIVAADSGIYHLLEAGCNADYLLGDMDSLHGDNVFDEIGSEVVVLKYPIEKDKTDMELAVDLLVDKGCSEIAITGGTGSRMDHTMANIQLLRKVSLGGINIRLIDDNNEVTYLSKEKKVENIEGSFYSILPLGPEGVVITLEGFHYPLHKMMVDYGSSLGISNYLEGQDGRIIIHSGEGLLIRSRD